MASEEQRHPPGKTVYVKDHWRSPPHTTGRVPTTEAERAMGWSEDPDTRAKQRYIARQLGVEPR